MLVAQSRPRNLDWFHAGPLLFGDWGTSRLYVLGLAFFYTGHAAVWYLGAMSIVMAAVAWAYTIVCRVFPEGGGVYTSARQLSPILSVIGATLLLCDYIVTAALSTVEAFKYFGTDPGWIVPLSVVALILIGIVNWFGARSAGRFALIVAMATLVVSIIILCLCYPFFREGLRTISGVHPSMSSPWDRWTSLVAIMLALSGVEAVSNMTGLMKQPVEKTARKTIWPVLIEVVTLNLIFGIAFTGLPHMVDLTVPDAVQYHALHDPAAHVPHEVEEYRDTAIKQLAIAAGQASFLGQTAGFYFGKVAAIAFGLLLLSASNTAVMAMVSVLYSMGQDREVPKIFTRLNYSGVPWVGLVISVITCILTVIFSNGNTLLLYDMYAVGVVGAITINIGCCVANKRLEISKAQRAGLFGVALVMLLVEVTIIATKLHATFFAAGVVGSILIIRAFVTAQRRRIALGEKLPEPATGWIAEIKEQPVKLDGSRPRIMLAARGKDQSEFAVHLAKRRKAVLFSVYVRTLRVMDLAPGQIPSVEDDPEAQVALGTTAVLARQAGVPFVPIYVTGTDIAQEILDYTVTYGCDTLIMGKTRRWIFSRKLSGDVISDVTRSLPDGVSLLMRSNSPFEPDAPDVGTEEHVRDTDDPPASG
ncbi:MAG TPA: universal stress protein [Phycisphaerales bacterium]|nr:universal stress protein [Phycisphaerales bacterium]